MEPNADNGEQPEPVNNNKRFSMPKFSLDWFRKLNRNTILAISLGLVLVLVGFWAAFFNKSTSTELAQNNSSDEVTEIQTAPALGAIITLHEGVVEYSTDGLWDKVGDETEMLAGMSLRTTGAASRAIVTLDDGSVIRLDANTEITFETLTTTRVLISQTSGYVYNRVVSSDDRDYLVRSENAQYESQGTAFRTIVSGDEEAVETYQSTVRETRLNISAEQGEKLTVVNKNNPQKDKSVEQLNIEQLKQDPFISWNRDLDSKDKNFQNSLGFLSDIAGPSIDISNPTAGSKVEVSSEGGGGKIEIVGKTEAGAKMTTQSKSQAGSSAVSVEVGPDGSFTTPALDAPLGSSVFEFIATDRVGNKSTLNITITLVAKASVQEEAMALSKTVIEADDAIKFEWGLVGMTTPDGVKLVFAPTPKASLDDPGSFAEYIETKKSKTILNSALAGNETWYFRACRYSKVTKKCDIYSNELKVVIP